MHEGKPSLCSCAALNNSPLGKIFSECSVRDKRGIGHWGQKAAWHVGFAPRQLWSGRGSGRAPVSVPEQSQGGREKRGGPSCPSRVNQLRTIPPSPLKSFPPLVICANEHKCPGTCTSQQASARRECAEIRTAWFLAQARTLLTMRGAHQLCQDNRCKPGASWQTGTQVYSLNTFNTGGRFKILRLEFCIISGGK